jgi:hypothetical protein
MKKNFLKLFRQSLLIWLATNSLAAFCYHTLTLLGHNYEPFICIECAGTLGMILLLGLAFSSPSNLLLIPILYFLNGIPGKNKKIAWSITSILFLCNVVVFFFFKVFHIPTSERTEILLFLLPYIVGGMISFLFISRKSFTNIPPYESKIDSASVN